MSYNDGREHMEFYHESVDTEKIAAIFSEGDDKLQKVLLTIWEKGIMTNACCKGHDDERHAYISFVINENSKKLIQKTLEYLYLQDDKLELNFNYSGKDYDTFIVYMGNEKVKEDYLNFINDLLSQRIEYEEVNNNIQEYGHYLLKFARTVGVYCRFIIEKDEMMFDFYQPGTIQLFHENSPLLDNIIQSIKETGKIPLVPLKCSDKSLQEFINLIYPNTFMVQNTIQK